MRVIPTQMHAVLDYIGGVVLIIAPWLFGFALQGPETWLPVTLGVVVLIQALCTSYELGVVGIVGMKTHLGVDLVLGIVLLLAPWLFQFAHLPIAMSAHVVLGILVIAASLTTKTTPTRTPRPMGGTRPAGAR